MPAYGIGRSVALMGIVLLGVGLSEGENSWPFLRSVILGGGENAKAQGVDSCGDLSTPPGTFVAAYDLDSLYTAIDRISRPGATNAPLETPIICQGTVCESGEVSFVLDQSLETVHVMSTSNVPNLTVYVYPPDEASPIKLMPGGKTGQDTGVSYEWLTERTLQFDLDSKSVKTWDGIWRMVFVDEKSQSAGQHVQVNLSLSSPLVLSWTNIARASFVADEPLMGAELSILDKAGGSPIDVTKLKGTVAMTVILKDSAGNTSTLFESEDTGVLGKSLTFDIDELALGSAMVTTTLQVSTASATTKDGTVVPSRPLAPVSIETQVQIETPPDYPTVASAVDFGLLDGVTTAEGTLAVTGPGCVWLPESEPHLEAVPNGVGQVGVNSNADSINNCVNLADGEKGSLPITFSVAESANGLVVGKASVSIAPTDSGADTRSTTVSFTADMRKPLNVQVAWVTFVIVLLLGVGIPVGIFYVFKVRAAVFVPGTGAWGIARAELPDGERGEARISLNAADMTYFSIARRTRTFSAGGYTFRTRIGALPTSGPRAELVDAGPSVSGKLGQRKGCAQVLLFLPGQWVAVLDQPDSPRAATVVVLANSNDPMEVEAMLADVRRDLAERVTDLKASASVKSDSTSTPSPEQKGATSENVSSPFGQSSSFGAASTATGNTNLPFSTTDSFGSQLVKPFGTDTSFSIDPPLGPESPSTGESPSSGNPFI